MYMYTIVSDEKSSSPFSILYPGSVAEAGVFSAEAGIRTFGSEPAPSLQVAIWKQILMHYCTEF